MTEEELTTGNDLIALINATQGEIDAITELLANETAMSSALLNVTSTEGIITTITVGDSSDAIDALNGKKTDLETTLASLQEQFSRL